MPQISHPVGRLLGECLSSSFFEDGFQSLGFTALSSLVCLHETERASLLTWKDATVLLGDAAFLVPKWTEKRD